LIASPIVDQLCGESIAKPAAGCPRHALGARAINDTYRYRWDAHYRLPSSLRADRRQASVFSIRGSTMARESIPDSLRDYLEFWRDHCPWHEDFSHREEVFSAASYQYILYGM